MISYGKNTFNEALKNKRVIKAYIFKDSLLIKDLIKNNIKYEIKTRKELDRLSNYKNHQGIVFEAKEYKLFELKDIINGKHNLITILDGLEDPHNLGAILRTSDAIGVDGIVFKKDRNVGLNDTVAKVSTGAIEYVKCVCVTNLNNTIEYLKQNGYWIIGLEADGNISYEKMDYNNMKIALVLGSEGKGISRLLSTKLDYKISLPLIGHVNSLNASNAYAIMLYKIYESRNLSTKLNVEK